MVCAATFVTCCKSDASVVIFASYAVVRDREVTNLTRMVYTGTKPVSNYPPLALRLLLSEYVLHFQCQLATHNTGRTPSRTNVNGGTVDLFTTHPCKK